MILSVIIPILNESDQLPRLFTTLSCQTGIAFEVILVDGGSTDGSLERAAELGAKATFPCRVVSSQKGRGRQFNAGVKLSCGETLLFLHGDSQFVDGMALSKAMKFFQEAIEVAGHFRIAGHFSLRFQRESSNPCFGFYYLESKARLDRPGCIHGDQGYLLKRSFFDQVGTFDESLGFLEDNRLAQSIRDAGSWLLLPVELFTSSRRFEQEGFRQRQLLNALVMNLEAVGRNDWLRAFPGIYRQQNHAQKLHLLPFYQDLNSCLARLSAKDQQNFWLHTGHYLVTNAWQLAFFLDVKQSFFRGLRSGYGSRTRLKIFDRFLYPLIDHRLGYWLGGLLARIWFRWQLFHS